MNTGSIRGTAIGLFCAGCGFTATPEPPPPAPPAMDLELREPEGEPPPSAERLDFDAAAVKAGDGRIACPAPEVDQVFSGIEHTLVEHGTLYARVPEAVGSAAITSDDKTVAVAFWEDAWPGEIGRCRVERPRILEHRIAVEGLEPEVQLSGCHESWLEEATVVVRSFAGVPCELKLEGPSRVGTVVVLADEPRHDLVLVTARRPPTTAP